MSWTLLFWSGNSCFLFSTLASYSWAYPLQASTSHVQSMHKSFTFLLIFYGHTLSSVKGCFSLHSASGEKHVIPDTRSCLWPAVIYCCQSIHLEFPTPSCPQFPHWDYLLLQTEDSTLQFWSLMISRHQYALLNFVRRVISNYSCIVLY